MATDVALSPDQKGNIMDFFKPKPSPKDPPTPSDDSIINKGKGILGYFCSTPRPSTGDTRLKSELDNGAKSTSHQSADSTVNQCKPSKGNIDKNESSSTNNLTHENGAQNIDTCPSVNQNGDSSDFNSKTQKSQSEKKGRLTTNKKRKYTKQTADSGKSAEVCGQESEQSKTESAPQEVDYAEFLKSFESGKSGANEGKISGLCDSKDNQVEQKKESKSSDKNSSLKVDANERPDLEIKPSKNVSSSTSAGSSVKKASGGANAFSMLMQARSRKQDAALPESTMPHDEDPENNQNDGSGPLLNSDTVENGVSVSVPSIANFFTKSTKSNENVGGRPVVVTVDVHSDPSEQKPITPKRKPTHIPKRVVKKVVPTDAESDIVFLGSETVEENEFEGLQKQNKSRRMVKISSQSASASEESSTITVKTREQSQHSSKKKEKPETSRPQKAAVPKISNVKEKEPETPEQSAKRKEFLQDSNLHPDTGTKRAQATLSFGKNGSLSTNALIKAEPPKSKKLSTKKDHAEVEMETEDSLDVDKTCRRRSKAKKRQRKIIDSDSEADKDDHPEDEASKFSGRGKIGRPLKSPRLSNSFGSDSGGSLTDFTPTSKSKAAVARRSSGAKTKARELVQKAKQQQNKKTSPGEIRAIKLRIRSPEATRTLLKTPAGKDKGSSMALLMTPSRVLRREKVATPLQPPSRVPLKEKTQTPLKEKSGTPKKGKTACATPSKSAARVHVQEKAESKKFMGTPSRTPANKGTLQTPCKPAGRVLIQNKTPSQTTLNTPSQTPASKKMLLTPMRVPVKEKSASQMSLKPTSAQTLFEEEGEEETASKLESSEQGSRRSSRRLVEQQQKQREKEEDEEKYQACISVDSDESECESPRKKRVKRKEQSPLKGRGRSPKKPAGKLAPIFTKKKGGEASPEKEQQPPEDPEVVRKRREFLMSGVPTELKRQAAMSAAAVVFSDFAPFSDISHVQQKSHSQGRLDVWSLAAPEKLARLKTMEDSGTTTEDLLSKSCQWKSFQWLSTVVVDKKDIILPSPVSCEDISPTSRCLLMKELQLANPDISVTTLCETFRSQFCSKTAGDSKTVERASVDSDLVLVDEDTSDGGSAVNDKDAQWPEILQPRTSSDMIGNKSAIRRLKFWLEEWRTLIQREARLSAQTACGGKDSDFDFSDSEEEGSQLCNTMLIVGPHGVGKTAAVYALASQLSYKVFEVNASSSRQGRHILAQLQEATQSHQVAQKKDGVILNALPLTPVMSSQGSQPGEQEPLKKTPAASSAPVPKAFANFFKKAESGASSTNSSKKDNANKGKVGVTSKKYESPKKAPGRRKFDSPKNSPVKGGSKKAGTPKKVTATRKRSCAIVDSDSDDVDVEVVGTRKRRKGTDEKGVKKRRGDKGEPEKTQGVTKDGEESNLIGCLNLTSTSLILFDEVDLAFEEDSGFLQTVQHFINTTKIPIIMTTSDPGFQRCINARFETLTFQRPPMDLVVSHLQTVSLAAGMRTCKDDVRVLAGLCNGDLRRCLLSMQFLALSGGGMSKEQQPLRLKPTMSEKTGNCQGTAKYDCESSENGRSPAKPIPYAVGEENDSEGEFVSLRPSRKKTRRIMDDEDDSASGPAHPNSTSSGPEMVGTSKEHGSSISVGGSTKENGGCGDVVAANTLPAVHLRLCDSLLGVSADLGLLFGKCLMSECSNPSLRLLSTECLKLPTDTLDMLERNLIEMLALPKTAMPPRWYRPSELTTSKPTKRRRIRSDLFDSEASDDENKNTEDNKKQMSDGKEQKEANEKELISDEKEQNSKSLEKHEEEVMDTAESHEENSKTVMDHAQKETLESESLSEMNSAAENASTDENCKNPEHVVQTLVFNETEVSSSLETVTVSNVEVTPEFNASQNSQSTVLKEKVAAEIANKSEENVETTRKKKTSEQNSQASLRGSRKCTDHGLGAQLLTSFARYYDTLSVVDCMTLGQAPKQTLTAERLSLLPGVEDVASKEDVADNTFRDELRVGVGLPACRHLWQSMNDQVSSWKQTHGCTELPDGCSVPVSMAEKSSQVNFTPVLQSACGYSIPAEYKMVATSVMDRLPLTSQSSLDPITLDYLPTLRAISQAERCRHIAKAKRMFHHHFDSIGLCLGESTVSALCNEFPAKATAPSS